MANMYSRNLIFRISYYETNKGIPLSVVRDKAPNRTDASHLSKTTRNLKQFLYAVD